MKYTYLTIRKTSRFEYKAASVLMDTSKAAKNVLDSIYNAIPHILLATPKHTIVQAITMKTQTSIELPIYKNTSYKDEAEIQSKDEQVKAKAKTKTK